MTRGWRRNPLAGVFPLRVFLFVLFFALAAVGYGGEERGTGNDNPAVILAGSDFSPTSVDTISELFRNAEADGIPAELLLPRLQEGVSKRVHAHLVVSALSEEIRYLTSARDVIGGLPGGARILDDPSNWARAANFLRSGQSEQELSLVAQASAGRSDYFRPATLLYLSVSEWGIEQETALTLIAAVAASNLDSEAYPEVTGLLADAQRARLDPGDAALLIAEQLREGRSIRQIARILRR
jgi:hypothetical protein